MPQPVGATLVSLYEGSISVKRLVLLAAVLFTVSAAPALAQNTDGGGGSLCFYIPPKLGQAGETQPGYWICIR